ncbi:MAG: shikimate dehydrogenase, partial [Clostridia bacterium]|nr:shikimate dehydrogenase [Clostridia bacterium]
SEEFNGVQYLTSLNELDANFYAVINATGVGMHDSVGISPVGEDILKNCQVAIDLIYVPEKSKFLEIAESLGKKIVNGKAMLFYQAYYAECIFFDVEADAQFAKTIFEDYLKEE